MIGVLYDLLTAIAERRLFRSIRQELLAPLCGSVVEVGAGTGLNFLHYGAGVRVLAVEPDPSMAARARKRLDKAGAAIELRQGGDELLEGLSEGSVDAVVFTLVLCSVDDPLRALMRARRVLHPRRGTLIVFEHVRSPGHLGRWQDRLTPWWERITDGCHLNRETIQLIARAGYDTSALVERRISRVLPIQHVLIGTASPRLQMDDGSGNAQFTSDV